MVVVGEARGDVTLRVKQWKEATLWLTFGLPFGLLAIRWVLVAWLFIVLLVLLSVEGWLALFHEEFEG